MASQESFNTALACLLPCRYWLPQMELEYTFNLFFFHKHFFEASLGAYLYICKINFCSHENEFNLRLNENWFGYDRMSTKSRFEKEARGNAEMAYWCSCWLSERAGWENIWLGSGVADWAEQGLCTLTLKRQVWSWSTYIRKKKKSAIDSRWFCRAVAFLVGCRADSPVALFFTPVPQQTCYFMC